jgi:hypothetical protein
MAEYLMLKSGDRPANRRLGPVVATVATVATPAEP